MMKYQIPVYWRTYSNRYYLTHPWRILKDIWVAYKNRRARARKGYAWIDLWNFDTYLGTMLPNAMDELADKSCGAPYGDFEGSRWLEFEHWQAEVHVLASLIRIANCDFLTEGDKFNREFKKWRDRSILKPIEGLPFYNEYVLSEEAINKIDSTTGHYEPLIAKRDALLDIIFARLRCIFDTLWD